MTQSVHQFSARSLKGQEINLDEYRGKWLLIVNTASQCGLTPQYEGLEKLYKDYVDQGLEILGFPCNQFGQQEPGSAEEIQQGCLLNYGVSFPMFEKIEVNGDDAHPLYRFLKDSQPGALGKRIKWNFTKFLVDPEGNVIKRYAPTTKPEKIEKDLRQLMSIK
ncbi:MAG: glutathione peroxidase [Pseudomonadota bacterium]